MKVQELLTEGSNQTLDSFLLKNCKSFLSLLDDDGETFGVREFPLYRGMSSHSSISGTPIILTDDGKELKCYIKTVRRDRYPTDTPADISERLDDALKDKFGWRPRSEGLFCFPHEGRHAAAEFGAVYQIFPMGSMKFVYNPKRKDVTRTLAQMWRDANIEIHDDDDDDSEYPEHVETKINSVIQSLANEYQDTGFIDAMEGPAREIMIKCDHYLMMPAGR